MKKCIVLANGNIPDKKTISFFYKNGYDRLICADGGANSARKLKLVPDFIIGDLDSVKPSTLEYFSGRSEVVKIKDQFSTDVEKCLDFAIKNHFSHSVLFGLIGNRLDHSICNLSVILKFSSRINLTLVEGDSILFVLQNDNRLKSFKGEIISLFGFDSRTKITSYGLKYKLKNESLKFGSREGESNVSTSRLVRLIVKGGKIFVVRNFEQMRKNDLI